VVNQLIALGLASSAVRVFSLFFFALCPRPFFPSLRPSLAPAAHARAQWSMEVALAVTPDAFISLFRRSTGLDLRQIRRRLRIVATRARNGEPLIPPSAFSRTPGTPTRSPPPHTAHPLSQTGSGDPHVRVVSEEKFRELAAAQRGDDPDSTRVTDENEPEEQYSSSAVSEDEEGEADTDANTSIGSNY
jgi:hypothetical protein